MERSGGVFARFVDDYKQIVQDEEERKFSFYVDFPVNTPAMLEKALREYASERNIRNSGLGTTHTPLSGCWKRKKETKRIRRYALSVSGKRRSRAAGT